MDAPAFLLIRISLITNVYLFANTITFVYQIIFQVFQETLSKSLVCVLGKPFTPVKETGCLFFDIVKDIRGLKRAFSNALQAGHLRTMFRLQSISRVIT